MSNYTPISNFTAKDALTTGDSNKRILGATIDAETAAIATAITSKLNTSDLAGNYTITGNITFTGTNIIPAAGLTGTVIDARLSANVPLLNAANTFTAAQSIIVAGGFQVLNLEAGAGVSKASYLRWVGTNAASTAQSWYAGVNVFATDGSFEVANAALGTLLKITYAGAITLNGVNATDFARLSQDNTFSKSGGSTQTFTSTSANRAAIQFQTSSVTRGLFGADGAAGDIIVGSALGDLSMRVVSGNINLSLDNGGTIHHKLTSSNSTTTFNGVAVSDFARLSQGNTFTNQTQTISATGVNFSRLIVTADSSSATFGASDAGSVLTGFDVAGDATIVGTTGVTLSPSAASANGLRIDSSGNFNFKAGTVTTTGASAAEVGTAGVVQNSQSVDYTCVLSDRNKEIYQTGASKTVTIPSNASVPYPIGTILTGTFTNATGGTIAITSDTMTLAATTSTGSRTVTQNGKWTAQKETATTWLVFGVGIS